jgi:hypothetical protein
LRKATEEHGDPQEHVKVPNPETNILKTKDEAFEELTSIQQNVLLRSLDPAPSKIEGFPELGRLGQPTQVIVIIHTYEANFEDNTR